MLSPRIAQSEVYALAPHIVKSLTGLSVRSQASPISPSLAGLIRLRVSQINGCAFCMHMHADELRTQGESQSRLDVLQAWRETNAFTALERAALHWAEALTRVTNGVSNEDFKIVSAAIDDKAMTELTAIILEINSWNRISVGFGFIPELDQ